MGSTTPAGPGAAGPAGTGPAQQAVPVAFTGRTSTLLLQDPVASLRRQVRECQDKLPAGWFIAAYYWDIESGGMDIAERGHGTAHEQFLDTIGIPRDGGLADLLKEAASPVPKFAAVICEDIERSGRDTFYALKLEKELTQAGIPLFATDEPIDIAGANATTVLIRRVKQGVAEWFRLQIKEKSWRGLREHSLDGWNIGYPAYGYAADRVPHPVPVKASQGRTKTRLILDPPRDEVIARIFRWRTVEQMGLGSIAARLNTNLVRYPPPTGDAGWTLASVYAILRNPKYTGYMVYGRRRKINGHLRQAPPSEWIWSPEPTHPAIIDRATWDAAQAMGREHASSRDGIEPNSHPQTRRAYLFRSRIRCRDCRRRMCAQTPAPTPTGSARTTPATPVTCSATPTTPPASPSAKTGLPPW
jgi:site-specific DNA recombinase